MKEVVRINARLMINSMLAGAVVSMFFLIASIQPKILTDNPILATQMVLAVPFLVSACMANSYLEHAKNKKLWYNFGWFTFISGYAFTLNAIGIIISLVTSIKIGLIFYSFSFLLPLAYSFMLVVFEKKSLIERIVKDFIFLGLQLVLGVLVILGIVG